MSGSITGSCLASSLQHILDATVSEYRAHVLSQEDPTSPCMIMVAALHSYSCKFLIERNELLDLMAKTDTKNWVYEKNENRNQRILNNWNYWVLLTQRLWNSCSVRLWQLGIGLIDSEDHFLEDTIWLWTWKRIFSIPQTFLKKQSTRAFEESSNIF